MAMLPNAGPPLPQTHEMLPVQTMLKLATSLKEKAEGKPLSLDAIAEVAKANGHSLEEAYASLSVDPQIQIDIQNTTLVAMCLGKCQHQGALENLQTLLQLKKERDAAKKPSFDIVVRSCLDMCAHAPVCLSRSHLGQAAHPKLQAEQLPEIVDAICEEH